MEADNICKEESYDQLFIDKAVAFLGNVREHNPDSLIVWAYSMLGKEMEPEIKEALNRHIDLVELLIFCQQLFTLLND